MTLRWVPGWNGLNEPEAVSYVAAVEAADGQELEFGVARAINDFVADCKQDKIWDAIKACCILAGARTTNGALVPLVGTAPTPNNFDLVGDTDYNRKTGLKGDGSTKYIDSNRSQNADPQNNLHAFVYVDSADSRTGTITSISYMGAWTGSSGLLINPYSGDMYFANRTATILSGAGSSTGGLGHSRNASTGFTGRLGGSSSSITATSISPDSTSITVFAQNTAGARGIDSWSNARLAFYSIGESLDLAALDTRVSNLITAIGAAIP